MIFEFDGFKPVIHESSFIHPQANVTGNVRIGKHITLQIEADSKEIATEKVTEACTKILCNQIMESYEFTLEEI